MNENEKRQDDIKQTYEVFYDVSRYFIARWLLEEEEEISPNQFLLLRILYERGRSTVSDLAGVLKLSTSATTIALNRLVKGGYVNRFRCDDDRRVVWVEVSEKAIPIINRLLERRRVLFTKLLDILTDEELDHFKRCLQKVKANLP